ncbi:MAG: DNA-processing protein DprA [bacterium]
MIAVRETPVPYGVRRLERGHAEWPAALAGPARSPSALHVRGDALPPRARAVAIVGSRAATPYGRDLAHRLARDLAAQGIAVVSGLARGIDAAAHEGALATGRTVAVLGSGLDTVTPPEHAALAERIVRAGSLVAERASGPPFGRGAFVRRNRIVAALAAVTVVVEAGEGSGALTTAAFAREFGHVVLAVPGDVDRPGSRGPLGLLRAGVPPCADAGDVLAHLPAIATDDPDARLRAALGREPSTVEWLAERAGLAPADALARLLRLGWAGLAVSGPGGRWTGRT